MTDVELTDLIERHPARGHISVACVKAFCMAESSCNPWAYRYEPFYKYLVGNKLTMTATERAGQMSSWGLMQVMGGVAREYGFSGSFPQLCDPVIALRYGMMHLAHFYKQHGNWPDAIASYNAGSPRRDDGGKYVNQPYVDNILKWWSEFESHVDIKTSEV